jgi:hypothetical protein
VNENGRRELAEAVPAKLAAGTIARFDRDAAVAEHHDPPGFVPRRRRGRVDAPLGVREAMSARAREPVVAAPSGASGREPVVGGQAMDGRAHRPLLDAEIGEPADQRAEPDRASVRGHGVTEDRDDKRAGPRRTFGDQARHAGRQGGVGYHRRPDMTQIIDILSRYL